MAKRLPNPNTKYGRKRIRNEGSEYFRSLTPEQQKEQGVLGLVVSIVIVALILLAIYLFGGSDGVKQWLSR